MRRMAAVLACAALLTSGAGLALSDSFDQALGLPAAASSTGGTIDPNLEDYLKQVPPDQPVSVLVYLADHVDIDALGDELDRQNANRWLRHKTVVEALQDKAANTQGDLIQYLNALMAEQLIAGYNAYWIVNAIQVDATAAAVEEIARRDDVDTIWLDYQIELIQPVTSTDIAGIQDPTDEPEPGLKAINVPQVWAKGITGKGVLVSNMDTGVWMHAALESRWVANNDSRYDGHPDWAWFDPAFNTKTPNATNSHGTHTMGTICGGAPGDEIGVAPGANWIAAAPIDRISISRTVQDAVKSFQWFVDPDGNPDTVWDVPHTNSNSWGLLAGHGYPLCDKLFWSFIDACEEAGIVVIFSAGNEGSREMRRPADRATDDYRTMAIGAVDGNNANLPIASFSSRGPTFCTPNGDPFIKPNISAPGVSVRSSVIGGGYSRFSGTSMASPHINGVAALMLEANPDLTVDEVKQIMYDTAIDKGANGKDNNYGWGVVDALAAVNAALAAGNRSAPESFKVTRGVLASGGLPELLESDGKLVEVTAVKPTALGTASAEIELTTTLASATPSRIGFTVESAVDAKPARQQISFYNYDTGEFEIVDDRPATLSLSVISVNVTDNPARFVDANTRVVRTRIGMIDYDINVARWSAIFDTAFWTMSE